VWGATKNNLWLIDLWLNPFWLIQFVVLPLINHKLVVLSVDPLKVLKDALRESMPNTVIANTVLRESADLNVDGSSRAIQPQHFTAHYSPNTGTQQVLQLGRLSS
jgi:hypothetical protein